MMDFGWYRRAMADSFTKHLPFCLLAKNLQKEFWSAIHKSILGYFYPYLFSRSCVPPLDKCFFHIGGGAQDKENKKGSKNPRIDLWNGLQNFFFFKFLASNQNELWSSIVQRFDFHWYHYLKASYFLKDFVMSWMFQKNEQENLTYSTMGAQVGVFLFFFGSIENVKKSFRNWLMISECIYEIIDFPKYHL